MGCDGYTPVVKHLVDLDEEALQAARAELGTTTLKDTVNESLRRVAREREGLVRRRARRRGARRPRGRVALTHLVDTSVLTRMADAEVRAVVEPLAEAGSLARAGISDLEIGYSARNEDEWSRLTKALGVFTLVETEARHVERARQVQQLLARRSQRGRKVPDLLVAAAAEAEGLVVLHYDAAFERIAEVTSQPHGWVVPSGSID
jgi:predicted nucleic acid-binding protein/Arc/MetJ family transcription regulator